MSLKTVLYSTLLAATALGQDYGSGSYGGGGGGDEWSSWASSSTTTSMPMSTTTTTTSTMSYSTSSMGWSTGMSSWSTAGAIPPVVAASCPTGCMPMPSGGAPPMQMAPGQMIVQVVSVSDNNGSLMYIPNNVQAPVGSIVQFQFHPKVCLGDSVCAGPSKLRM